MQSRTAESAGAANLPFGRLVIQSLDRLGVGHFVVSPGSRSTPLALAAVSLGAEQATMVLDERSAAFHALGRVKATGRPAALICTSGTAGAHYYPAVIEAREAALPLIVLTADRPPELRHCHAGQTIDQLKLYGSYPLFHAELPLPEADPVLMRQVREICRRAVESAMGPPSGPVHLNCPFREPFFSVNGPPADLDPAVIDGLKPLTPKQTSINRVPELPARTLILAGPRPLRDPVAELEALLDLSRRHGFPILADGSNPLRYHEREDTPVIVHYDRIARVDALWEDLKPEAVVCWGEPPTSKVLRQRLASLDVPGYQVGTGKPGMNPFFGQLEWLGCSVAGFDAVVPFRDRAEFARGWEAADKAMEERLGEAMKEPHALFEGDVYRMLPEILPRQANAVFASSLAIRDAEWFIPAGRTRLSPHSQRGANGIDGTLSLARGIAAGSGKPAFLFTGDLAFLHDGNGLLGSQASDPGLFVILFNNNGGGIFEFLPVAGQSPDFEMVFATPQDVDLKKLVEAHGGHFHRAESLADMRGRIRDWDGKGVTVVEVPVDRKESTRLHKQFLDL